MCCTSHTESSSVTPSQLARFTKTTCYKKFRAFPKGHSISVVIGVRPSSVKAESFQPFILRLVIGIIYDHTRSY